MFPPNTVSKPEEQILAKHRAQASSRYRQLFADYERLNVGENFPCGHILS